LELGVHQLAHRAAAAVAADEPRRPEMLARGPHLDRVAVLLGLEELRREVHHGVRISLQLLEQDRREPVLLEVEAERVRREVRDQAEVPLDDHALLAVADLPARHLDAVLQHLVGDAVGRQHLEGRRMIGARALVDGQRRLLLEHLHRDVLPGERERGGEADRAGADDGDGLHALKNPLGAPCRRSKPVFVTRISSPTCTPAAISRAITFGCTTTVISSSSVILGRGPAGRLFVPTTGGKYPPPKPCIRSSHTVKPRSSMTPAASTISSMRVPCLTIFVTASNAASAAACRSRYSGVGSAPTLKVRSTCPE